MHRIKECDDCGIKSKVKLLKRINGSWYCKSCYSIRRVERRKQLHDRLKEQGIIKLSVIEKSKLNKGKIQIPKIQGIKKEPRPKNPKLSIYLSLEERQFLFRRYISQGYSSEIAKLKVDEIADYLHDLVVVLKEENKSEEKINEKFQEEFLRLVQ